MDGGPQSARIAGQPRLPGLGEQPEASASDTRAHWLDQLQPALVSLSPDSLCIAEAAVRACPADPALLLMAALAALVAEQPDRATGFLKRFERKFAADKAVTLLTGLALAGQGYPARAWTLLDQNRLLDPHDAFGWFIGGRPMVGWLVEQLGKIGKAHDRDCLRIGGQAAIANCGCESLAAWNLCPKPEPNVPL